MPYVFDAHVTRADSNVEQAEAAGMILLSDLSVEETGAPGQAACS